MKKKLLALAVAGAFVAPVAMADSGNVTIYGQVNASVVMADTGDGAGAASASKGTSSTRISSDQSRIGFKGAEDLGGGMSAVWQIESGINVDGGSGTWASRNTFVGLSAERWGTAVLGNHDSPYKSATRGYDLFADTVADNRTIMGIVGQSTNTLDARNPSSLTYTSPDLYNFKVSAQYVAGAEGATVSGQNKGSNYSLSLGYAAGPITATAAMVQIKAGSAGTGTAAAGVLGTVAEDDKIRGLRIGGSYKQDAVTLNAVYERIESDIVTVAPARADTMRANTIYVGGKYAFNSSDAVKLAFTSRGEVGKTPKVANSQMSQWSLGFDHAMSKRTLVYALCTKLNNNINSSQSFANISTAAPVASGSSADPVAVALGVKHSF